MTDKIFRDCENGRKNSENVPSYDGNFMGHIRTDCATDSLCQSRIHK